MNLNLSKQSFEVYQVFFVIKKNIIFLNKFKGKFIWKPNEEKNTVREGSDNSRDGKHVESYEK